MSERPSGPTPAPPPALAGTDPVPALAGTQSRPELAGSPATATSALPAPDQPHAITAALAPELSAVPAQPELAGQPASNVTGGPVCVLIGAPGAGKTKIGKLLAAALGVGFRDTDHDVEIVAGKPVAEIFLVDGESRFRELEAAAVATALREHSGILSLGGGAVLDPATQSLLAHQRVVWLQVSLAVAAARTGLSSTPRPLLMGNVRGTLKKLLDARNPVYAQVARFVIDADADDLPTKVAQISQWLAAGAPDVRNLQGAPEEPTAEQGPQ